ncbi:MAG: hypothetical protein AB8B74_02360 [Crocinitomicaceae bacterium]
MKLKILSSLTICLLLMSCNKDIIEPAKQVENNKTEVLDEQIAVTKGNKGRHIIIITNVTTGEVTHVECYGYGGGCGPTITVDASAFNPVLDIINTEDNFDIADIFDTEQNQLNPIFGSLVVSSVINGDYTVKSLGTYVQTNGQILTYIQIFDQNNDVISSHELNIQ